MVDSTDTQDTAHNNSLSPVWYSPSSNAKSTADSNVLACKARLEVITKTTIEHFQKWCLTDKRGLQLCLHIEGIKTKLLEQMNTSTEGNSSEFTLYPATMKPHCNNLSIIATICRDIAVKTKESLKQLKALSKLPGSCNEIFYRSWELDEFIAFLTELAGRYEKEAEIRLAVAENLPHCTTRSDLIRWTSAWEYPQYVDSYVHSLFKYFNEELENRNKG
uniref:Cyclin-dependent kinase 2-interacting protein n=1 Tax=Musca domestica TaxID=7370 RepID=A0A1I8MZ93_MUSDO